MDRKIWVSLCWVPLALWTGAALAQAPKDPKPKDPKDTLNEAYTQFCKETGKDDKVCASYPGPGARWLVLSKYCANHGSTEACKTFSTDPVKGLEPLALGYDHPTGIWHARNRLDPKRVEKDVAGKPTVSLTRDETLVVVVENTNPLLYTVAQGAASEANIPELTDLQKLAGLLGGGLQALLATKSAGAQGAADYKDYQDLVSKDLTALMTSLTPVQCSINQASQRASQISAFVQQVEIGAPASYPLHPTECRGGVEFSSESVSQAFGKLSAVYLTNLSDDPGCLSLLNAGDKVLASDPSKPADVDAAVVEFRALQMAQSCHPSLKKAIDGLGKVIGRIQDSLSKPAPELAKQLSLARDERVALRSTIVLTTSRKDLLDKASALLQQRDAMGKTVAQIQLFEQLLRRYYLAPVDDAGFSTANLDDRLILETETKPVSWDKIQTRSIKLKASAPLGSSIAATRPGDVEASYSLDSVSRSLWGIGASVIYTHLKSPTFSAVTNPANAAQLVIAQTDQETRAGQLALFFDYRLVKKLCPESCGALGDAIGVELGAALDNKKPGFFGGLSFHLGKYVRLGAGWTYQQVKELRGQNLGDVVKAAGDIKTKDTFKGDWYLSFSFALESIRLFSSGN